MTSPASFITGPPLFPGLIAASVWMKLTPPRVRIALTMPRVTVLLNVPSGEPTTKTCCPTFVDPADPRGRTWRGTLGCGVRSSARSASVSMPATRAATVSPVPSLSVTSDWSATTWAEVSTLTSLTKNPLPVPRDVSTTTTAGSTRSITSSSAMGAAGAGTGTGMAPASASTDGATGGGAGTVADASGAGLGAGTSSAGASATAWAAVLGPGAIPDCQRRPTTPRSAIARDAARAGQSRRRAGRARSVAASAAGGAVDASSWRT